MALPYNLTFIENSTGVLTLFQGVNDNSGGWFIGILLITTYVFLFMVFGKENSKDAFLGSTFIITLLSGAAFGAGMIAGAWLGIPAALLLISLFVKLWGDT